MLINSEIVIVHALKLQLQPYFKLLLYESSQEAILFCYDFLFRMGYVVKCALMPFKCRRRKRVFDHFVIIVTATAEIVVNINSK